MISTLWKWRAGSLRRPAAKWKSGKAGALSRASNMMARPARIGRRRPRSVSVHALLDRRAPGRKIESWIAFSRALQRFLVPIRMAGRWKAHRFQLPNAQAFDECMPAALDAFARPRIGADPIGVG